MNDLKDLGYEGARGWALVVEANTECECTDRGAFGGGGVDALGDLAPTTISRIRFLVSNRAALEDTARLAAIDEARRKAAAMAERAGVHLGRVRVIEEIGHSTPVGVEEVPAEDAAASEPTAAPIFGGDEQVTVSVRIIFIIY